MKKKELMKHWRDNNKEYIRQYNKKYRENHKEKFKILGRKWREEHPEYSKIKCLERRKKNPDSYKDYNRRPEVKEKAKLRMRERRKFPLEKEKIKLRWFAYSHYREELIEKYNGCQICGSKDNLDIHHDNYTINKEDIKLVCKKCHQKLHKEKKEKVFEDENIKTSI